MRSRSLAPALALALALAGTAAAQPPGIRSTTQPSDLLLRINAPVTLAPAESASTVVVIGNDAWIRGTVREQLVVVNGTAHVDGVVLGSVAVVGGALELGSGARVARDVQLYRSTISRAPGATIGGTVTSSRGAAFGQWLAFGVWVSMTLVVIVFGLLFAAAARSSLLAASSTLAHHPGAAVATMFVTWGAAFVLAMLGFMTVIGIPLALAVLFFLLPALAFAGYLVAGMALGHVVLGQLWKTSEATHPNGAVVLGLLFLQLLGFVPVLGALFVLLAAALGAGALVFRAWEAWRERREGRLVPAVAG